MVLPISYLCCPVLVFWQFTYSKIALLNPIGKQSLFSLTAIGEMVATYYCYQLISEMKWGLKKKWEQSESHVMELMNEWTCTSQKSCFGKIKFFSLLQSKKKIKQKNHFEALKKVHKANFIVFLSGGLLPNVLQNREDLQWIRQGCRERTISEKMQYYQWHGLSPSPCVILGYQPCQPGHKVHISLVPGLEDWSKDYLLLPSHLNCTLHEKYSSSVLEPSIKIFSLEGADAFSQHSLCFL